MADILQLESGDDLLLENGVDNLELEAAAPGGGVIPVIIKYLRGHQVSVLAFIIWYLAQQRG